jgi:hypothetical protein
LTSHYSGKRIVLATMHDKDQAIAPAFSELLGAEVVVPPDLDTDELGTFSGEVPRRGTMGEVAEAKARLGMSSAGLAAGLASEGSFGPHPASPFVSAGMELLVFVDDELDLTVSESLVDTSPCFDQLVVASEEKLAVFLERVAFPEHALIVVPNEGVSAGAISKGIRDRDALSDAIARAQSASSDGRARVETDMRAHMNPTRMATLGRLAEQLARRIASNCPACGDAALLELFEQWRAFERPPMLNGAPDYTAERFAQRHQQFKDYQARLQALDPRDWTTQQQVDWHLVRAEMNGFDFNHRVLKPWVRDPAFYQSIWMARSDVPGHEGPTHHAVVELWQYELPLSADDEARLARELGVIAPLMAQANAT